MKLARWKAALGAIFLVAVLSVPALSNDSDNRHNAVPGTLNYIEGQASIADQKLDQNSVGSADLQAGQVIDTSTGKVELLLIPGVYFRLGNNSSVRMVSPNLTNTELSLDQGDAMLEVDEIHSQNDIRITQPGASTRILKTGLYEFSATNRNIRVFDGKAQVEANDRNVTLKGGHELDLNSEGELKAQGFDKKHGAHARPLRGRLSARSALVRLAPEKSSCP